MAGSTEEMSGMAPAAVRRCARLDGTLPEMVWRYAAGHFGKPPKPKSMLAG